MIDHEYLWTNLSPKLVAILRGIQTHETAAIVETLLKAGFRAIEIPLNSPDPIASIELAVATARSYSPEDCLIGAGTVLNVDDVEDVCAVGGNLIVSPNSDIEVIRRARELGAVSLPGVMSPSECFLALKAGATALKFFPASLVGPEGINAMRAVLPEATSICAVGGVSSTNIHAFRTAGVDAIGLGSNLYKAGDNLDVVRGKAKEVMASFQS